MKYIVSLLFLFSVVFLNAQIEESISDFHTIKVFDLMTVNLVKSDENQIVISGKDAQDVEYVQKNGILKVRMRFEKTFDGENTFVHVHYKELKTIDSNEGAIITSNELITQDQLEVRVQEGATVRAGLKVGKLDARAVTGGILELTGSATYQDVVVNTGGIVENDNLRSDHTTVKVKAGGEVEVHALQSIDVDIKAGGDVYVTGNPKEVRKKTFAGGRIEIQ